MSDVWGGFYAASSPLSVVGTGLEALPQLRIVNLEPTDINAHQVPAPSPAVTSRKQPRKRKTKPKKQPGLSQVFELPSTPRNQICPPEFRESAMFESIVAALNRAAFEQERIVAEIYVDYLRPPIYLDVFVPRRLFDLDGELMARPAVAQCNHIGDVSRNYFLYELCPWCARSGICSPIQKLEALPAESELASILLCAGFQGRTSLV
jgi:hypothetical protein